MEGILTDCVQNSLRYFMYRNAIFLCERLCAEFPSEVLIISPKHLSLFFFLKFKLCFVGDNEEKKKIKRIFFELKLYITLKFHALVEHYN